MKVLTLVFVAQLIHSLLLYDRFIQGKTCCRKFVTVILDFQFSTLES